MVDAGIEYTGLNLVAEDVEATMAFYRLLGFSIPEGAMWQTDTGTHHVSDVDVGGTGTLEFDSPALARAYNAGFAESPTKGALVIGFRVPSREAVDALHDEVVAAGHPSRQEPHDAFWGARYAIVADPDGRDIGLMSPVDPSRRRPPPSI